MHEPEPSTRPARLTVVLGLLAVAVFMASCCCPEYCENTATETPYHTGSGSGSGKSSGGSDKNVSGSPPDSRYEDRQKGIGRLRNDKDEYPRECAQDDYVTIPGEIPGNGQNPLHVIPRLQEGFSTCWATCAEMITDFWGRRLYQCEQVGSSCCDSTMHLNQACDRESHPGEPNFGLAQLQSVHRPSNSGLDWISATPGVPSVTTEIQQGRPFAFSWKQVDPNDPNDDPNLKVGHMMTVIGYTVGGGRRTLIVLDPRPRPHVCTDVLMIPFSDYHGSAACPHQEDIFMIRP